MRPIGFEPPEKRLQRSLFVGLIVGVVPAAIATVIFVFASVFVDTHSALAVAGSAFGLGFFTGFWLAVMWPDFAPPQPRDDGDAEAGVPARLVPPAPTLNARISQHAHAKSA